MKELGLFDIKTDRNTSFMMEKTANRDGTRHMHVQHERKLVYPSF